MHTFALTIMLAIQIGQILADGLLPQVMTKRRINSTACLDDIYVMGFTSGLTNANTDDGHAVEIKAADQISTANLPNNPSDDSTRNKGDLWKMSLTSDFTFNGCIRKIDIEAISIVEDSNDAWNIESIVTFFRAGSDYQLATLDMEVNQWIDGNDLDSEKRFELNLVIC